MSENPNARQQITVDNENLIELDARNSNAKPKYPAVQSPNHNPNIKPRTPIENAKVIPPAKTIGAQQPPMINDAKPNEADEPEFNFHSKVGELDPLGRKIEAIYFSSDGKYFIYHIGNYSLEIVAADGTLISKNLKVNQI